MSPAAPPPNASSAIHVPRVTVSFHLLVNFEFVRLDMFIQGLRIDEGDKTVSLAFSSAHIGPSYSG